MNRTQPRWQRVAIVGNQPLPGGLAPTADEASGAWRGTGMATRVPQARQRTLLPRAESGTDRMVRHFRLGQMIRKVFPINRLSLK